MRARIWWIWLAVVVCWLAQSALPADTSAQQSAPLTCPIGTIYQIQRASSGSTTGRLNAVDVSAMSGTNPVTATQVTPSLIPATNPGANALGISAGGVAAWALAPQSPGGTGDTLTFTLRKFDPATDVWTSHTVDINTAGRLPEGVTAAGIRSQGIVAGAIDPHSGNFFWAYLASAPVNRMVVFGFNTTTNQPIGVVANSTLPQETPASGGTNGDIAFDGAGNLFVVSNTGTNAAVGVIQGPLPETEETHTPTLVNTRLTTFANPQSNSYNGIAFSSIGELFIQWSAGDSTFIRKISPQNGASIAGPSEVQFTSPGGGIGVDLGCNSAPPTMQLRKSVDARRTDTDQFHLSITGGDITEGNTATTSGTETGVQAETAGPVVARAGTTYTFTETGAGTTNLDNYGTEWRCVNQAAGNGEVAEGTGTTFTLTPAAGEAILCTFTNHYHAVPNIDVVKTGVLDLGANGVANVGDTIHYTITVHNTGTVTLRNVTVTDTRLSPIVCPGGTHVIPTLGVDEEVHCTATYAITQADIDAGYVPNFATATGTPPQGPDVTDGDGEQVPIPAAPGLAVEKTGVLDTGVNGMAGAGDTIHYTIRVRNTGNVTLRNVRVTEERLAGLSPIVCPSGTHVIATLGVGEFVDCTATYQVTQADVDHGYVPNFARATGTPPEGPDVTDGDDAVVPITPAPGLDVEKTGVLNTGANGVANPGDTINYTITVRNTGNVTLSNVTVTDTRLSAIDCGGGTHVIATLGVGQFVDCTATYAITPADIDAGFVPNFATATGTPPHGPDVTDGDEETVPITAHPALAVEKTGVLHTGANGVANAGDTIHYTITVRNTGNVTLSNVTVTEHNLAGLSAIDCGGGTHVIDTLRVGESVHCTATYEVTQADVDVGYVPNFATATGTPPHGPDVTDGDEETVPITAVPGLAVEKTGKLNNGANGVANVGDTIHYTITVRNTGNVTLRNVRVTEHNLAGLSAIDCGAGTHVIDTLRVGESVHCTATYKVTQADIDHGFVPNFATATGTPPHGPDVTDGDDAVVPVTAVPGLDVQKTGKLNNGANGVASVGDTIHYTITVRNTGNVTLRNVRVTEHNLAGLSAIDCGAGTHVIDTLRVGQFVDCTATYKVTQADVHVGYVPNFATATGTPPHGPDVTNGDNNVQPIGGLVLHKTARPSVVTRGSTVRFSLRVANTSGLAAHEVRVCDTQPRGFTVVSAPGFRVHGRTVCKLIGTLEPGRSKTVVFTARARARAPSRVTNTATATSSNAQRVHARARVRIVPRRHRPRPPAVTG